MRTHIHTARRATVAGAILGATVLTATVAPWAQPAAATMGRSPMLDPPVLMGDPLLVDPPVRQVPGGPVDSLLAQVQQLVNALVPPCVPPDPPPDQSDPTTVDYASTSSTTQPCDVVVARNVESPGAVAVASQSQDAPVTQTSDAMEAPASD
jgi:hypothetical protein